MCFVSLRCICNHRIAMPNPDKTCIRPRHPRGCTLIRRAEDSCNTCPGCGEYYGPNIEQIVWHDVVAAHEDPELYWSEACRLNIIEADRTRHANCENERLHLRKMVRWRTMVGEGRVLGWGLNDRGVPVIVGYSTPAATNDESVTTGGDLGELIQTSQQLLEDTEENSQNSDNEGGAEPIGHELRRFGTQLSISPESGRDEQVSRPSLLDDEDLEALSDTSITADAGMDSASSGSSTPLAFDDDDDQSSREAGGAGTDWLSNLHLDLNLKNATEGTIEIGMALEDMGKMSLEDSDKESLENPFADPSEGQTGASKQGADVPVLNTSPPHEKTISKDTAAGSTSNSSDSDVQTTTCSATPAAKSPQRPPLRRTFSSHSDIGDENPRKPTPKQ